MVDTRGFTKQAAGAGVRVGPAASVAVGSCRSCCVVDLYYRGSRAGMDRHALMDGRCIGVRGTAERGAFGRGQLDELPGPAGAEIGGLFEARRKALAG